jgi:hypothetical protein
MKIVHAVGMKRSEERYLVDGVEVLLVRDDAGVHWECEECAGRCAHVLGAAVWVTLQSWSEGERSELH